MMVNLEKESIQWQSSYGKFGHFQRANHDIINLKSVIGATDEDVRARIEHLPSKDPLSSRRVGQIAGYFARFVADMSVGDWVLIPDGKGNITLVEVISDYYFDAGALQNNEDDAHRRNIKVLSNFRRSSLSEDLKSSSKAQNTIINLNIFLPEIEALNAQLKNSVTITDVQTHIEAATISGDKVHLDFPENLPNDELKRFFKQVLSDRN